MTEEKLSRVHDPESEVFTPRERAVLRFVGAMHANDAATPAGATHADAVFAELRTHFDEAQIVEIGFTAATLHGLNLFNNVFGIDPEDQPMVSHTGVDRPDSDAAE